MWVPQYELAQAAVHRQTLRMTYDVQRIRANFPALGREIDGNPITFFDNPAGTQVPSLVAERMSEAMFYKNANLGGSFTTSLAAQDLVDAAHRTAEVFMNAPH